MFYNPDINFVFGTVYDISSEIIMVDYCVDYMQMEHLFFLCCIFSYVKKCLLFFISFPRQYV